MPPFRCSWSAQGAANFTVSWESVELFLLSGAGGGAAGLAVLGMEGVRAGGSRHSGLGCSGGVPPEGVGDGCSGVKLPAP